MSNDNLAGIYSFPGPYATNVWPKAGKLNIDQVEFGDLTGALSALSANGLLRIGHGSFPAGQYLMTTTPISIAGSGINVSVWNASGVTSALSFNAGITGYFQDFAIINSDGTISPSCVVVQHANANLEFRRVKAKCINTANDVGADAWLISLGTVLLLDCEGHGVKANGTNITALNVSTGATATVVGGYYQGGVTAQGTVTMISAIVSAGASVLSGGNLAAIGCTFGGNTVISNNSTVFAMTGGKLTGNLTVNTGATAVLDGPTITGTVSGAGTIKGNYFDSDGNLISLPGYGQSGGVWIYRADGLRIRQKDFPTAVTNLASGDTIVVINSTITLTTAGGGLEVTASNVKLKAEGWSIITSAVDDVFTLDFRGSDIEVEGFIIEWTGAGTAGGPVGGDGNNIKFTNCLLNKTSGAPTSSYGIWQYGGTGWVLQDTYTLVNTGTNKYGYYNNGSGASAKIFGGSIEAATQEIFLDATCTVTIMDTILVNGQISNAAGGTLNGIWKSSTGQVRYLYPYPNGFQGQATNYKIVTSVASNDLTVALKNLAGNDPSDEDRISVRIGDIIYDITAALSTTKNDGTNWLNLGAVETATLQNDLFVYLIAETGASAGVKIGFARIPWAEQMGDFTNTTTNANYIAGNWTNFNTTDKVAVIGRFNAILSATAAFNWSLPATSVIINRPIFETRWTTYAAQVTSGTGTITTVGTVTSLYQITGRTLNYVHDVTITTNGTGATSVKVSMPFTPITASVFVGRERGITGDSLTGTANGNTLDYRFYDGTYPGANGAIMAAGGGAFRLG